MLKEKYSILEFKIDNCGTIIECSSILIDKGSSVVDDGWNSTTKKFKYTKDSDSNNNVEIDLSSYLTITKYFEKFRQETDGKKQKVTLTIKLKSYNITFG